MPEVRPISRHHRVPAGACTEPHRRRGAEVLRQLWLDLPGVSRRHLSIHSRLPCVSPWIHVHVLGGRWVIAAYCMGGTGCYAGQCNCTATGSTSSTASTSLTYRSTPHSYASNIPASTGPVLSYKEELKAKMREYCRELTLAAQEDLAWIHDHEVAPDGHPMQVHYRRPGRRRTCTATRNFRRAS